MPRVMSTRRKAIVVSSAPDATSAAPSAARAMISRDVNDRPAMVSSESANLYRCKHDESGPVGKACLPGGSGQHRAVQRHGDPAGGVA